jgi:hypothetical protein
MVSSRTIPDFIILRPISRATSIGTARILGPAATHAFYPPVIIAVRVIEGKSHVLDRVGHERHNTVLRTYL